MGRQRPVLSVAKVSSNGVYQTPDHPCLADQLRPEHAWQFNGISLAIGPGTPA
jgi:hypothetical protein